MESLFGTDGIRSTVGVPPLTHEDLSRLGNAIGRWVLTTYGPHTPLFLAHDGRISAHWISSSLLAGIMTHPITVKMVGLLPTPALSHLLKRSKLPSVGIVISASHNPFQDNGIKILNAQGKINTTEEQNITNFFYESFEPSYRQFGSITYKPQYKKTYENSILALFDSHLLDGVKIVLDCAHGAASRCAPLFFSRLGAEVIVINNKPNGININQHCGALHTYKLRQAVVKYNATLGCAFDGDGDRIIFITADGTIKHGDDMLALLSYHPRYQHERIIVGTVMSNQGLELFLNQRNKQLVRAPVGDRNVFEYMKHHNALLGGEQSGHIILDDVVPVADGIVSALSIIEVIILTNNWKMQTFDHYPQHIISIDVNKKPPLDTPELADLIEKYKAQLTTGRLIVRYSGTENLLRIMIEDTNDSVVTMIANQLPAELGQALQKLY